LGFRLEVRIKKKAKERRREENMQQIVFDISGIFNTHRKKERERERERERVWVSERVIEKDPEIYVVCIIMFEKLRFLLRERKRVQSIIWWRQRFIGCAQNYNNNNGFRRV